MSTSIILQSREGTDIENLQGWELTGMEWRGVDDYERKYPEALFLAGPCPVYNCHGLSLASRRTSPSPTTSNFSQLLAEDGYHQIPEDQANVGDLILYYDEDGGAISHSGIVVGLTSRHGGGRKVPVIWSKWGKGREAVHAWNMCPYLPAKVEYYRMKSWGKSS
jgi:hypothetical protein